MKRALIAAIFAATALLAAAAVLPQVVNIKTSKGDLKITSIAHGSLLLEWGGKEIFIDPWSQADLSPYPKADWIFITHQHGDHYDPAALALLKKPGTHMIVPPIEAKNEPDATVMKNGDQQDFEGFHVQAVPAYNNVAVSDGGFPHEKGVGNGYIFTFGGKRIYVAGDTGCTDEMRALKNIDVAFLPMYAARTMTPEQAADCAKSFKPKILYAYHYRDNDPRIAQKLLAGSGVDARIGAASPAARGR